MATALKIEDEFTAAEVKEFPVKAGKGYSVHRGPMEFARGLIEAYVYIEFDNGDTVAERMDTEQEFKLWTEHLA